jgi:hypothetical protein
MPSSDLIGLAILPAAIWASLAFIARSTSVFASNLRAAWSAERKQDLAAGARSFALYELLIFFIALIGVVVWTRGQGSGQLRTVLSLNQWEHCVLLGIASGLTLIGLLLNLRRLFPMARKFSLLVMAGVASSPLVRASVLLLMVFTEELWRATCINSLLSDGFPGPRALFATSAAYSLAYMAFGVPFAISEGIVGAAFGGLFLWSGSFLVPLIAHVILQTMLLLCALAAAPDAGPGIMNRKPFARCPACERSLNLRQVSLGVDTAFLCPNCHARLTSSDRRRGFFRRGLVIVTTIVLFASWEFFPELMRFPQSLVYVLITSFACAGFVSILQVLFPPKFEFGDPEFVGLDLDDRAAVRSDGEELKKQKLGPDSN